MSAKIQRPLHRQRIGGVAESQVADRTREQVNRLSAVKISGGVHIEDVELPSAAYVHIKHALGRKLLGWIVTDLRGAPNAGVINRVLSSEEPHSEKSEIVLVALHYGATITVRLWVY